jgi:LacI family transcriptional regulator
MTPRATLRDIARQAGCHYSTVSLALRNHPRIAPETRARVQQVATALGYRPDAMLAALNAYRLLKRPLPTRSTLAWITNYPTRDLWRHSTCKCNYHEGARRRAEERGYRLEHFWLREPGMTGRRMSAILRARGIQGVLLAPQQQPGVIDLDWADFSAVTIGYTLRHPRLHNVYHHHYRSMGQLLDELALRDYRRPGLVEIQEQNDRVEGIWLAAYLAHGWSAHAPAPRPVPLLLPDWNEAAFHDWFEREQPDVIVSKLPIVAAALRAAGRRVPEDVGVALHSLIEETAPHECAGMTKSSLQVGQMAVDLLVDMIHRNERGVPELPHQLMIDGTWNEGHTLRPRVAAPEPIRSPAPAIAIAS